MASTTTHLNTCITISLIVLGLNLVTVTVIPLSAATTTTTTTNSSSNKSVTDTLQPHTNLTWGNNNNTNNNPINTNIYNNSINNNINNSNINFNDINENSINNNTINSGIQNSKNTNFNTNTNFSINNNNNDNNFNDTVSRSTESVSPTTIDMEIGTTLSSDAKETTVKDVNSGYDKLDQLFKNLMKPGHYNTRIRPVSDQSRTTMVRLVLDINELVSLDDVSQKMVTDCYIVETWTDELLTWNTTDFDFDMIQMDLDDVWRPGLSLSNSMDSKDILGGSSNMLLSVFHNGSVSWEFEEFLTTSCTLNMDKYPFDQQTCHIELWASKHYSDVVDLSLPPGDALRIHTKNPGWTVVKTQAKVTYKPIKSVTFAFATFTLTMQRRPTLILINDILPTVALSFLNCFVFFVPVDSGEKISFGNSVVLALAVFISDTTTRLPSATEGIPAVTKYLGFLFANSIAAVLLAILNVRLHHYIEKRSNQNDVLPPPPQTTQANNNPTVHPLNNSQIPNNNTNINNNFNINNNDNNDDEGRERRQHLRMELPTSKVKDGHSIPNHPNPTTHRSKSLEMLVALLKYAEILDFFIILGFWVTATGMYIHYIMW